MSPEELALRAIPRWVGVVPWLFYIPLAVAIAALCQQLSTLYALPPRSKVQQHWTEFAQMTWPARSVSRFNTVALPVLFGVLAAWFAGPWSAAGPRLLGFGAAFAVAVAVVAQHHRFLMETGLRVPSPGQFLRDRAAWLLAVAPHYLVAVLGLAVVQPRFGLGTSLVVLGAVGLSWLLVAGGSLKLAMLLGLARPGSARLRRIADLAANRVGIRPRAICELDCSEVNGLVNVSSRTVVITRAALENLDDEELVGVVAHELGHLEEPRAISGLRAGPPLLLTLLVVTAIPAAATWGLAALVLYAYVILSLIFILGRMIPATESFADEYGRRSAADEQIYARTLERMYRYDNIPAVMPPHYQSHPDLWSRMVDSGLTPAFKKPEPPAHRLTRDSMLICILIALMATGSLRVTMQAVSLAVGILNPSNETAIVLAASPYGGSRENYASLGRANYIGNDLEDSIVLYRAAVESQPADPNHSMELARVLGKVGRCDEAASSFHEALTKNEHASGKWHQPGLSKVKVDFVSETVEQCRCRSTGTDVARDGCLIAIPYQASPWIRPLCLVEASGGSLEWKAESPVSMPRSWFVNVL